MGTVRREVRKQRVAHAHIRQSQMTKTLYFTSHAVTPSQVLVMFFHSTTTTERTEF